MGHTALVRKVTFSPDGTRALSGSDDNTMRLWDLKKGEQIREPFFSPSGRAVKGVAFLPDGQQAISGDSTVRLWDLTRDLSIGRQLRTFDGHTIGLVNVKLSPDGRRILSCGADQTARLWDRFTGREIATLLGHRNCVQSGAFTPDGALRSYRRGRSGHRSAVGTRQRFRAPALGIASTGRSGAGRRRWPSA